MARSLDRYELKDVLGTGAFATVWRAHDPVLGIDVAIKVLADNWTRDVEMRQRFLTEARNALEVTNEHLVRVHHVAEAADDTKTPYIVMAIADGGTLEERNRQRRLLSPDVAGSLRTIRDIAIAVSALHNNGLLHRDLKPGNVLFQATREGSQRLVLGDFGLARAIDRSALTMVSGTPAYAAPEQAAGLTQLTPQADLYPLGVMFLEMLTGDLPTANDSMADAALSRIDIAAALRPIQLELEPNTRQLIDELLDPEPENRPGSAREVATRIDNILGEDTNIPAQRHAQTVQPLSLPVDSPASRAPVVEAATQPTTSLPSNLDGAKSPLPKVAVIAVVLLGLIGIGIVAFLLLGGLGPDETTATSITPATETTQAADTTQQTTTTQQTPTAPEPETSAATVDPAPSTTASQSQSFVEIPSDFPIPDQAILDVNRSNGALLQLYNIAGTPDALITLYAGFAGWTVENTATQNDQTTFDVTNGTARVTITAEAFPNTTGLDVTVFQVEAN